MTMKSKRILKRVLFGIVSFFLVMMVALLIYSSNPYQPHQEMYDAIDLITSEEVTIYRDRDEIRLTVSEPLKNIIFIPGGLVNPESYLYLCYNLALQGYNVTIYKPVFHLAIFTPNHAKRFLSDELENVIIGHSLGGVVSSMLASKVENISQVILMGSYPIQDISNQDVLLIKAEFDIALDEAKFNDSLKYTNDDKVIIEIDGGNHAGFGWYGPQKGDGEAEISIIDQQQLVLQAILNFIA